MSADQLHPPTRPHLGRELSHHTRWSNPLDFVRLCDGKWTLAGHRQQPTGRHAKRLPSRFSAGAYSALVIGLDGIMVEVAITALDAVAPFVAACTGRRISLTLNEEHAFFRGSDLPFQGGSTSAALDLLLFAWALEEVSLGERLREQMADTPYPLGKRIQGVTRAV